MKIKELVRLTALLLGKEDVTAFVDANLDQTNFGADTVAATNVLADLTNVVVGELATSYIPVKKSQQFLETSGKIYYSDFSDNVLRILSVTDVNGVEKKYIQYPEYIIVDGAVTVVYEYLPKKLDLQDDLSYEEKDVPSRVLAYGTASEYCITQGEFDQAVMWHKRYVDEIEQLLLPKNHVMKKRRWG